MDVAETGQISTEAAEVYERLFVPALFGQFALGLGALEPFPIGRGLAGDRNRSEQRGSSHAHAATRIGQQR